jgi:hypothetical protein
MSDAVTKFIKDQGEAVKVALDLKDTPSDYNIHVDAINAALNLHGNFIADSTMTDVVASARVAEKYLRSETK